MAIDLRWVDVETTRASLQQSKALLNGAMFEGPLSEFHLGTHNLSRIWSIGSGNPSCSLAEVRSRSCCHLCRTKGRLEIETTNGTIEIQELTKKYEASATKAFDAKSAEVMEV